MSLESNGAIEVPLILRSKNGAVDLPVEIPQEVLLANVGHLICKENAHEEESGFGRTFGRKWTNFIVDARSRRYRN